MPFFYSISVLQIDLFAFLYYYISIVYIFPSIYFSYFFFYLFSGKHTKYITTTYFLHLVGFCHSTIELFAVGYFIVFKHTSQEKGKLKIFVRTVVCSIGGCRIQRNAFCCFFLCIWIDRSQAARFLVQNKMFVMFSMFVFIFILSLLFAKMEQRCCCEAFKTLFMATETGIKYEKKMLWKKQQEMQEILFKKKIAKKKIMQNK